MHQKRRVILFGSGGRPGVLEAVEMLRPSIEQYCDVVGSDMSGTVDFSQTQADLAVTFGGDGSVLRAVGQMGTRQIPTLTVNLGTLGFLANIPPEELIGLLQREDLLQFPIIEHILLCCRVFRRTPAGDELLADGIGLNEITIVGSLRYRIIYVDLFVDGEAVTTYRCDGLILCTPVGSTAHNLSAGGPIVRKDLDAVVLSPLSPHTLTHRPVVDSADRHYEIKVREQDASVILDGTKIATIGPEDLVSVQKAAVTFKMIAVPGGGYYRTLREKLGWGGDMPTHRPAR